MTRAFRIGDPCGLCGEPILRGQEYSVFTDFLPSWSSLAYASGKAIHHACFDAWPFAGAFEALMRAFEREQAATRRCSEHRGYDFECECDRLDPLCPNARAASLKARWAEHVARSEAEWDAKSAGLPERSRPTLPSPPPDPNEPVLERLHPDVVERELQRFDEKRQPWALMRFP